MNRLSTSLDNLKPHYTVVVIGSGYGGAISASRLARAGQSVCLLERGKEFQPGEFPDTLLEASAEMQVNLPGELGLDAGAGAHEPGADGGDANAFVAEFGVKAPGEAGEGEFAGDVGQEMGDGDLAADG